MNIQSQIRVILQVSAAVFLLMYCVTRFENRIDFVIIEKEMEDFQDLRGDNRFNELRNGLSCVAFLENKDHIFLPYVNSPFKSPLLFPIPKIIHSSRINSSIDFQFLSIARNFQITYDSNIDSRHDAMLKQFCHSNFPIFQSMNFEGKNPVKMYIVGNISIHIDGTNATMTQRRSLTEMQTLDEFYELKFEEINSSHCYDNDEVLGERKIEYHCVKVFIFVASEKGISNSLSTLSQIFSNRYPFQISTNQNNEANNSNSPFLHIIDWPDNHWRGNLRQFYFHVILIYFLIAGLLLDVSRHFQPITLLKRCIDAMHGSKLNTLHLHLTDSQSFPLLLDDVKFTLSDQTIETLELSKLAKLGSFSAEKTYTKSDLREVVAYGLARGVDVIPEIDMPAHTLSWGNAFKDVYINCSITATAAQTPWNIYPLDPSNEKTFQIIYHILSQLVDIFPSRYLHIGGDEVSEQCWREDEHLMRWARDRDLGVRNITRYFEERVFAIVYRLGKVPIVWQGILDGGNMPDESSVRKKLTDNNEKGEPELSAPIVEPWKCWGGK